VAGAARASYETERRPAAVWAIAEVERNMKVLTGELSGPGLDDGGPDGEQARLRAAGLIRQTKTSEMYTVGFVLGTVYGKSPVVVPYDRAAPMSDTSLSRSSGAPGGRLAHRELGPGRSLYDELGPGFAFVEVAAPPAEEWDPAAASRSMPWTRYRLNHPELYGLYGARYVLARPDRHVAWRGDDPPCDLGALHDREPGETAQGPARGNSRASGV
jgi:hypothetical protein